MTPRQFSDGIKRFVDATSTEHPEGQRVALLRNTVLAMLYLVDAAIDLEEEAPVKALDDRLPPASFKGLRKALRALGESQR